MIRCTSHGRSCPWTMSAAYSGVDRARACFTSLLLALRHVQRVMDALQGAVPVPELEIVVHRALRRQILGQRLPLAAGPQHVEDPVQNLAHVPRPSAPAVPAWRD